jgi:hypothetical protein
MAKWKEQEKANLFKFENEGDSIEGKLLLIRETETKFGSAEIAEIQTPSGTTEAFLISAGIQFFNLDSLIGKTIKLVYTGKVKNETSGNSYKDFKLYIAE